MRKTLILALLLSLSGIIFGQMMNPIKWDAKETIKDKSVTITYTATIEDGWHLYGTDIPDGGPNATTFTYDKLIGVEPVGEIKTLSPSITKFEEMFGIELTWFEKEAIFTQEFKIKEDEWGISTNISFMGCNDETCYMGDPTVFAFGPLAGVAEKAASTDSEDTEKELAQAVNDLYTPVIDQLNDFGEKTTTTDSSLWTIFILGLLGGLVALFTPCVWPIIPMTVSFFLKRSGDKKKGRRDAFIYGLSIIIIYLVLGIAVTLIFGAAALNELATNAIFNIFFFLLLVVFAVSFFGAFEITLPASWSSKMDAKAESTTGFLSILLMAFTLVLVSFSCTGPIIGTLLVEAAQGSILGPAVGMFGFALALALPFSIFAMFPSMLKSMPKSGGWLNSVKVVLGFLELALSLKFLSVADLAYGWGILDRETFIVLWVVIFALLGFYLLGKITLPHDDKLEKVSVTRLMLAIISFAYAIYLIPGLWGAPLRSTSAFAPPLSTQDFNLYTNEVHADATDYEIGMQMAKSQNKPLMVDFSGFGCVNCRKMEAAVWTNDEVANLLREEFILVTLMVDDRTPLAEPFKVVENGQEKVFTTVGEKNSYIQRHKFGSNAQPFYVIVDTEGNPVTHSYAFDEDPGKFAEYLKSAIKEFEK